jgi:hypothetical protein
MRVVKAERWHRVETSSKAVRRCSVCGESRLTPTGETVLDSSTMTRYGVVRCGGCAYDLLEELPLAAVSAAS